MTDPRLKSHEAVHAPKKPAADGERFPKRRQPEYVTWFDAQKFPCLYQQGASEGLAGTWRTLSQCWGTMEKAHLKSRGAAGADVGNIVPLCSGHHRHLHRVGQKEVEYELGKKLRPVARKIESEFYAEKKHGK